MNYLLIFTLETLGYLTNSYLPVDPKADDLSAACRQNGNTRFGPDEIRRNEVNERRLHSSQQS